MKKIVTSLITMSIVMLAIPSQAAEVSFTSKVSRFMVMANGRIAVSFEAPPASCTSTSSPKRFWMMPGSAGMTDAALKEIFTALLFAKSRDENVTVYFESSSINCYILRASAGLD